MRRDGVIVETARSPRHFYANGRRTVDARQNRDAKPIDFGPVSTAGDCRLTREGKALLITPLPSTAEARFAIRLCPDVLPWQLPRLTHVEAVAEDGKASARGPLRREGDTLVIKCEPGVFAYRVVSDSAGSVEDPRSDAAGAN